MITLTVIKTVSFLSIGALLVQAAYTDIKHRRISNKLCLGVCFLFAVLAFIQGVTGISWQVAFLWPVISGLVILSICSGLFALNMMGGGDVKLIAAMALVAGPLMSLSFVLYVALLGGVVALCTLAYAKLWAKPEVGANTHQPPKVPYGVAISACGLWVCAQRFSEITV